MNTILSPHLDDAVLSLGQYLATEQCTVVTAFAGVPQRGTLSDYDRSTGFDSSHKAMFRRRQEDQRACAVLGATPVHWDYLDQQYGGLRDPIRIELDIAKLKNDVSHLFVPLGVGHPDHRCLARCARMAVPEGELLMYEELPYRVLHPEQVQRELERVHDMGFEIDELPWPLPQGDRGIKEQAIAQYSSQFPAGADDPCVLVPERVWRCTR